MSELGIRSGDNSNVVQMLEEALQRQDLLLVLDNFEHVVEAADLVGEMLQWSTDLRVLVTSRARLRVAGEHVHEVHPLAVESERGSRGLADAVALFDQVATAVDPHFELAHHTADVVGDLPRGGRPAARDRDRRGTPAHALPVAAARAADQPSGIGGRRGARPARTGSRPSRRRSTGACSCSARRSSACSGCSRSSTAPCRWRPSRRCGPTATWSTRSASWWTTASCGGRPATATSRASGCSRSCATTPPGWSTGPRGRPGRATRRTSRPGSTTSTSAGGPTRPTAGSTTSARCCRRCGRRTRGPRARGDLPLTARITAALGAYWFLEGHHAEGLRWIDEMLAVEDRARPLHLGPDPPGGRVHGVPLQPARGRTHWERATVLFRELGETRLVAYGLAVTSATYIGGRRADRARHADQRRGARAGARRRQSRPRRTGAQHPRRADPGRRARRGGPRGLRGGPADLRRPGRRDVRQRVPLQPQLPGRPPRRPRGGPAAHPPRPCASAGRRAGG